MTFYDSDLFNFVLLPAMIFVARIFDVSIGTLRIIFVSKGKKVLAPILGFFEVLIWIIAISKIMENATHFIYYIFYAGGFAAGNYIGMLIEEKLAYGVVVVRIITQKDADELRLKLIEKGYGITILDALGANGKVNVIFTTINRHDLKYVIEIIKEYNPKAFYSVEDVKFVNQGVFPALHKAGRKKAYGSIRSTRKGK